MRPFCKMFTLTLDWTTIDHTSSQVELSIRRLTTRYRLLLLSLLPVLASWRCNSGCTSLGQLGPTRTSEVVGKQRQSSKTPFTRYNRLSNGFDNRIENRVERTAVRSTGCQTGLYNRFDKHGLTTGWMFVYTIQPVVKRIWQPVWQWVWQLVVSCIQTFTRLSDRFDNRLCRVNGAWGSGMWLAWSDALHILPITGACTGASCFNRHVRMGSKTQVFSW